MLYRVQPASRTDEVLQCWDGRRAFDPALQALSSFYRLNFARGPRKVGFSDDPEVDLFGGVFYVFQRDGKETRKK